MSNSPGDGWLPVLTVPPLPAAGVLGAPVGGGPTWIGTGPPLPEPLALLAVRMAVAGRAGVGAAEPGWAKRPRAATSSGAATAAASRRRRQRRGRDPPAATVTAGSSRSAAVLMRTALVMGTARPGSTPAAGPGQPGRSRWPPT